MKKIILFILVGLSIDIYSQRETHAFIIPQGFTLQQLNSKGTSNLLNHISNITSINPAALYQFQKPSIGISYQFETKLKEAWFAEFGSHRINNITPQSAGIILPVDDFRFGLGMSQVYNSALDIENSEIRTFEHPEGTGIFFSPDFETTVYNYSFLISYSIENFLSQRNELIIGTKYNLNRLHYYVHLNNVSADVTGYSGSFGLGAILEIDLDEYKDLKMGLSFESEISFRKFFSYKGTGIILVPPNDSNYTLITQNFLLTAKTPSRLKLDVGLNASRQLKFLGNITEVFWNAVSDNINNQMEFSASAIYSFSRNLSSSLGFYSTNRNFKEDFFRINDKMNAFFTTAGLEININNIDIDLAVADSHLFSGEFRNQTIGKLAVGFHL